MVIFIHDIHVKRLTPADNWNLGLGASSKEALNVSAPQKAYWYLIIINEENRQSGSWRVTADYRPVPRNQGRRRSVFPQVEGMRRLEISQISKVLIGRIINMKWNDEDNPGRLVSILDKQGRIGQRGCSTHRYIRPSWKLDRGWPCRGNQYRGLLQSQIVVFLSMTSRVWLERYGSSSSYESSTSS